MSVNFPQCMFGLKVHNELIYKNTILWASSIVLLELFEGIKCCHRTHGVLMGGRKTKLAQVWPYSMCAAIVEGMQSYSSLPRTKAACC